MNMESDKERHARQYGELIAKAWSDTNFKARLVENPKAAMAELGIGTLSDIEIVVLEASLKKAYFVIPPEPDEPIDDLDLTAYAAHYYIDGSG
jgi:Nitrile hydratase, alpha chain